MNSLSPNILKIHFNFNCTKLNDDGFKYICLGL